MVDNTSYKEVNTTLAVAFKALWRMVVILTEEHDWPFPDLLPTHLVQPISERCWKRARMGTYEMQKQHGLLERVAEFYSPKRASVFRLKNVRVKPTGYTQIEEITDQMLRDIIAQQDILGLIEAVQSAVDEEGVYTPPNIEKHTVDQELDKFVRAAAESNPQFDRTDQLEGLLDLLGNDTMRVLAIHGLKALLPNLEAAYSRELEEITNSLE